MQQTPAQPRQLLPPEAYTSDAWHKREQRELFARSWVFAGMEGDLKAPGDYQVVSAGAASLILLRDEEGSLRAFHNVCRHRGTRLLEGRGNVARGIACFYHRWAYDLAGRLTTMALGREQFPGVDKATLGLLPAAVGTWQEMVFVNPDPAGEPFETWLADVASTLVTHEPGQQRPHGPAGLVEVADVLYRVKSNWKIVVENFIDGYHLPILHHTSLADGDFMQQRWWPVGRHIAFYRPLKPGIRHDNRALPVIDGIPASYGASYVWFFPNMAIFETATSWSTFHVLPVSANECHVHSRIRAMPGALEGHEPPFADIADPPAHVVRAAGPYAERRRDFEGIHPLASDDVMMEDIYACEAVQQGLETGFARVGPLARWEATMTFFQGHVLEHVPLYP